MRAFIVAWRALLSLWDSLFFLIGISLLWWVTGGVFVGLAAVAGYVLALTPGPWWIAPLVAIPAGPASVALAEVARRAARGKPVDRGDYLATLRGYWRPGLLLSTLGMIAMALLLLNILFYRLQPGTVLRTIAIIWVYLLIVWLSVQVYVYPIYASLEQPSLRMALRMAALAVLANPLFSTLLLVVAGALTALCAALPILLPIAWPALMALLGEHALELLLQRADGGSGE